MNLNLSRPLIAGLGFVLAMSAAFAQVPGAAGTSGGVAVPVLPGPGAGPRPAEPIGAVDPATVGIFPELLIREMALSAEQQTQLDAAQNSRKAMWAANRVTKQNEYDALSKEMGKGNAFDPRVVIAMRKTARAEMETRMDNVQALWLQFWDALNPKQRSTLLSYMLAQHERHGKLRRPPPK